MISLPKRAVTRFFIPLIDVLILLFCIFLLMPYVEKGALGGARLTAGEADKLKRRIEELQSKLEKAEKYRETPEELKLQIADLKKRLRANPVDLLKTRTLQIAESDGSLFYQKTTPDSGLVRIRLDSDKARQLVADDRKPPFRQNEQKLVYFIVRPQNKSLFPKESQVIEYERWFKELPVEVRRADTEPSPGRRTP